MAILQGVRSRNVMSSVSIFAAAMSLAILQSAHADVGSTDNATESEGPSFKIGQVVETCFYLRNTRNDTVTVVHRGVVSAGDYKSLRVIDVANDEIPVKEGGKPGVGGRMILQMAARSQDSLRGFPVCIGDRPGNDAIKTIIGVTRGQECRVQVTLPNFADSNAKDELQTGEFVFNVVGPDAPEPRPQTDDELKKLIAWGKPNTSGLQIGVVLRRHKQR